MPELSRGPASRMRFQCGRADDAQNACGRQRRGWKDRPRLVRSRRTTRKSGSCLREALSRPASPEPEQQALLADQLAQFTPSMNRSIASMLPAIAHVSIHNNPLYWSKDCSGHCRLRAEPMLVQNGGESVFARAMRCFPIVAFEFLT